MSERTIPGMVDLLHGLRVGLNEYLRGDVRVGLVYCLADGPLLAFDPQHLIQNHAKDWQVQGWERLKVDGPDSGGATAAGMLADGTVYATVMTNGRVHRSSRPASWTEADEVRHHRECRVYVEPPREMIHAGPVEFWTKFVAERLHDLSGDAGNRQRIRAAEEAAEGHGDQAVEDAVSHLLRKGPRGFADIRVRASLRTLRELSFAVEEGALGTGRLLLTDEPSARDPRAMLASFSVRPQLSQTKHVRKILRTVEGTPNHLVSDGREIFGIGSDVPHRSLSVEFQHGHARLFLGSQPLCLLEQGSFFGAPKSRDRDALETSIREKLVELGRSDTAAARVADLADRAVRGRHGCTIVVADVTPELANLGHPLSSPLDLSGARAVEVASAMSAIDGALLLDFDGRLHGFGLLLDGSAVSGEDRSRGARFNSALRFTKTHPGEAAVVVVVSEDGPTTTFFRGTAEGGQRSPVRSSGNDVIPVPAVLRLSELA